MKKLPVGIQSFEKLIKNNFLYVDKTKQIYELATQTACFFISRPRRFGKSLLCATFQALFQGKKELFKNLWIEQSDWKWEKYPVIYLDLSRAHSQSSQKLEESLSWMVEMIALDYGIDVSRAPCPGTKLSFLVKMLAKEKEVIILVDEYDKPILNNLMNSEQAYDIRAVLRDFYASIKALDESVRFVFLTGATKFSKTSIFSGLNNLTDLTMLPQAATLLGYTQDELIQNFLSYIQQMAKRENISREAALCDIRRWYNGYKFFQGAKKVYNPFSILSFFKNQIQRNYWFATGTPTFLINFIKKNNYPMISIERAFLNESDLDSFDIDDMKLETLLFQTGYLTMIDYHKPTRNYILSYPNYEVRLSLTQHIMRAMTGMPIADYSNFIYQFKKFLECGDIKKFCDSLQHYFASIPYTIQIKHEKYYQTLFFSSMLLIGADIDVEVATNVGRIDAVIQNAQHIYIFEFKVDKTPGLALEQIKTKKYYEKYLNNKKRIFLVGITFSSVKKNIESDWKIEEIKLVPKRGVEPLPLLQD